MRCILVAAAIVLSAAIGSAQSSETLDVTVVRPSEQPRPQAFELPIGGVTHFDIHAVPLEVTLLDVGPQSYRMGEAFVYRLRIRNIGPTSFALPWEPDWTRVIQNPAYPIAAVLLGLQVSNQLLPKGIELPKAVVLYGSNSTPVTVKTLAPGASADVRIPARWTLNHPEFERTLGAAVPNARVRGMVALMRDLNGNTTFERRLSPPVAVSLERAAP